MIPAFVVELRKGEVGVRARLAALALVPAATALGCGGSSSDTNGEASKPAQQIVSDAAAAVERVHSLHMQGKQALGNEPTALEADLEPPAKVSLSFDQRGGNASIIAINGAVYIKANAAYWKKQKVGRAAETLAGKWFKSPTSAAQFQNLTRNLDVATVGRCLARDHGTLSVGGKATVNGQPAVVVVDQGDNPGGTPAKLFVATKGEPLPLRLVATGNERPGRKLDPECNSSGSRGRAGDELTFSKYNQAPKIAAPPGALNITPRATAR
jgi:hypothetical protein